MLFVSMNKEKREKVSREVPTRCDSSSLTADIMRPLGGAVIVHHIVMHHQGRRILKDENKGEDSM